MGEYTTQDGRVDHLIERRTTVSELVAEVMEVVEYNLSDPEVLRRARAQMEAGDQPEDDGEDG